MSNDEFVNTIRQILENNNGQYSGAAGAWLARFDEIFQKKKRPHYLAGAHSFSIKLRNLMEEMYRLDGIEVHFRRSGSERTIFISQLEKETQSEPVPDAVTAHLSKPIEPPEFSKGVDYISNVMYESLWTKCTVLENQLRDHKEAFADMHKAQSARILELEKLVNGNLWNK